LSFVGTAVGMKYPQNWMKVGEFQWRFPRFSEAIHSLAMAAGDADTNAAVAGALRLSSMVCSGSG